jgi:5'-phosphate synthase pdxT subunit
VESSEIRRAAELAGLDGIIIPGGESTTFHKLLTESDLGDALLRELRDGLPAWGTCAGAILLGYGDGRPQPRWRLIDIEVARNAYGRQVDSFVASIAFKEIADNFSAVFIRAPRFIQVGAEVEVLARLNKEPVAACQGNVMVTSFHPELTDDPRIHRFFLDRFCAVGSLKAVRSAG